MKNLSLVWKKVQFGMEGPPGGGIEKTWKCPKCDIIVKGRSTCPQCGGVRPD